MIILKVTIPVANIDIYHRILQKEAKCMCFNIHTGIWHESIVTLAIGTFLVFVTSVEWLLFLTSNMIRLFKSPIFQKLIWMHILWYQLYWVWSPTCHCLAVWGSLHCRCSRLTSNEWLLLNFSYLVSELFFFIILLLIFLLIFTLILLNLSIVIYAFRRKALLWARLFHHTQCKSLLY